MSNFCAGKLYLSGILPNHKNRYLMRVHYVSQIPLGSPLLNIRFVCPHDFCVIFQALSILRDKNGPEPNLSVIDELPADLLIV